MVFNLSRAQCGSHEPQSVSHFLHGHKLHLLFVFVNHKFIRSNDINDIKNAELCFFKLQSDLVETLSESNQRIVLVLLNEGEFTSRSGDHTTIPAYIAPFF